VNQDADSAEEVGAALGAMDVAFADGDGDAYGPSQLVVGRLVSSWRHTRADGWRITLLMNSHARPIEEVT